MTLEQRKTVIASGWPVSRFVAMTEMALPWAFWRIATYGLVEGPLVRESREWAGVLRWRIATCGLVEGPLVHGFSVRGRKAVTCGCGTKSNACHRLWAHSADLHHHIL